MSRYSLKNVAERRAVAAAVVEPMLRATRDRKVEGTYKRMQPGKDGRIHTLLSPDTASSRLSSSESLLYPDSSTNLQNMEKKVARLDPLYQARDCFVAPEGMVLLAADYKGAEAILCGAYSEDWAYVEMIFAGADTHQELAKFLFDTQTPTKLQRDIAKTIRYASQYNASVPTITRNLNKEADTTGVYFSIDEVTVLHNRLLQMHPLERWWAQTLRELASSGGVLYNCFGYRRVFHDPDDHERLKEGLSFYPQSTVGCLTLLALPALKKHDLPGQRTLLLQVHDEHLWMCRESQVDTIRSYSTPILERHFTIHDHDVYLPSEWKVGPNWGQMKTLI